MADLVRSYADAGNLDAAQRYLDGVLAKDPASVPGRLLLAGIDQMRGDPAAAEAGYRAIEVAKANGSWTVLDNAEALREPDDFAAALDAVPAARAAWDAFPPSTRKFGITNVDSARRPETRAARIAKIVADAAEGVRP